MPEPAADRAGFEQRRQPSGRTFDCKTDVVRERVEFAIGCCRQRGPMFKRSLGARKSPDLDGLEILLTPDMIASDT